MGASLTEALMGLGQLDVDLDYDPSVLAELVDGTQVILSLGEDEVFAAELLWDTPSKRGIRIGGRGLDYRLGQDGDGPIIRDREYLAGTNKLANPGFEDGSDYWGREESSVWTIEQANDRSGTWAARVSSDPAKDDVLQADEGGYPTRPGDEWSLAAWVKRLSGAVGRLRARLVFEGRFKHVGVFPGGTIEPFGGHWLDYSDAGFATDVALVDDAGEAKSGHWTLQVGPCTRKTELVNGGFETGDFTGWDAGDQWHVDLALPRAGLWSAYYDPSTGTQHWIISDADPGNPGAGAFSARPGERWHVEAYVFTDPLNLPDGAVYMEVARSSDGVVQLGLTESPRVRADAVGAYRKIEVDFEAEPETNWFWVTILSDNNTTGYWYLDDVSVYRITPNVARVASFDAFPVVPGKEHALYANIMSGPAFISGSLKIQAKFTADGRVEVIQEGPTLNSTDGAWQFVKFSFTPPSGYDECRIGFIGTDILGDSFRINIADLLVQYEDTSTRIYDVKSDETEAFFAELTQAVTTPDGAERVQVEIVAEDQADGWVVDDVNLHRVTASPVTFAEAVESLLVDPDTDEQLLEPGNITGDDTLLYDLLIINKAERDVLKDICRSGVVSPVREFRVNADGTLDAGTAEQIFTDRTDAVLVPSSLELLEEPTVERNWEDRVSDVIVIGAERQLANGRRVTITGSASDPAATRRRTRVIEDSTVDHKDYAVALAGWHLEQSQATDEVVQLRLADWRASFDFDTGDWIYPWMPEAGLEDLDNEMLVDGQVAYPKRVRAIARTWQLGSGPWRLELQRADGSRLDVSDSVRWEDATTAEVTVGNVMPEFIVDPQGGPERKQFLRFRASRPQ